MCVLHVWRVYVMMELKRYTSRLEGIMKIDVFLAFTRLNEDLERLQYVVVKCVAEIECVFIAI